MTEPLPVRAAQGGVARPAGFPFRGPRRHRAGGLTIVEMLVAMSITLLVMAAVVTVFANISGSVTRRRATIEMSSALRNVRETLARDLAGATCPAVPWRRPEANEGYLEIIEGPQNDYYPTPWLYDGTDADSLPDALGVVEGIDLTISSLPGSNLGGNPLQDIEGLGQSIGSRAALPQEAPTDGRGLGDADDTLMLTVRNESEPFVGRIPLRIDAGALGIAPSTGPFPNWTFEEAESALAEVIWYAVENPVDNNRTFAFGEPGYRTIYRRALLILPDLEYRIPITDGARTVLSSPGVVRVVRDDSGAAVPRTNVAGALAALIGFQERYDLSVRLEWEDPQPTVPGLGRWLIKANTLGDLTKRENRYEHHGFVPDPQTVWIRHGAANDDPDRYFPFPAINGGVYPDATNKTLAFVPDPAVGAVTAASGFQGVGYADYVVAYERPNGTGNPGLYADRPLVVVTDPSARDSIATARAILDEDGRVVHVTSGLAPLGRDRRGEDVMMTDALAFDLRVYDPGAPLYEYAQGATVGELADQVIDPGDPIWARAYFNDSNTTPPGAPGASLGGGSNLFRFKEQGAYVDLGYALTYINPTVNPSDPTWFFDRFNRVTYPLSAAAADIWDAAVANVGLTRSRFYSDGLIRVATGQTFFTRRFATYDTWSSHYESNGVNEDGDRLDGTVRGAQLDANAVDEGVNGLDDPSVYRNDTNGDSSLRNEADVLETRLGPDDYNERETRPPYDSALRGMQVTLRVYERDSRQIREVRVRESFIPE